MKQVSYLKRYEFAYSGRFTCSYKPCKCPRHQPCNNNGTVNGTDTPSTATSWINKKAWKITNKICHPWRGLNMCFISFILNEMQMPQGSWSVKIIMRFIRQVPPAVSVDPLPLSTAVSVFYIAILPLNMQYQSCILPFYL